MKRYITLFILFCLVVLRLFIVCGHGLSKCADDTKGGLSYLGIEKYLDAMRDSASNRIREKFPSPHSELLLGMLLGINDLKNIPRFNDILKRTGTVHVVVVSGYNISLVFDLIVCLIGSKYKIKNLIAAQVITLLYCLICGFQAPVIRAWIMGCVVSFGKYYGRSLEALQVLIFCALVMLFSSPSYLFNLSFQLSFMATFSLIYYSDMTKHALSTCYSFLKSYFITNLSFTLYGMPKEKTPNFRSESFISDLSNDFCSSISAQVLVWPLISYNFGRVSILAPFINAVILWTVPLSTILGGVYLLVSFVNPYFSTLMFFTLYPLLDVFVSFVRFFSLIKFCSVDFKISFTYLFFYYFVVLSFPKILRLAKRLC